jgi:hypothetical protein
MHLIAISREHSHLPIDVYSLSVETIAERCGVTVATAKRWKLGQSQIPYTAVVLLSGHLGAFSQEWQEWRLKDDALISPDGERISQASLVAVIREAERLGYSSLPAFAEHLRRKIAALGEPETPEADHPS